MKKIVIGILAHVDSGKTTLSEALLYLTGVIRRLGRVDHKDAFLDTNDIEREHGITIFSKEAVFQHGGTSFTLLDTPGHVDFSAETERTLRVLDYAVLVVSGVEKVQSHTETIWNLLKRYNIPCFIFVNKMDIAHSSEEEILSILQKTLDPGCLSLSSPDFAESAACCDEQLLELSLEEKEFSPADIAAAVLRRSLFPVCFGSALKTDGVENLLNALDTYSLSPAPKNDFAAKVFKITEDERGNRLTHMKITGGQLRARDFVNDEKINEIRLYSGSKFQSVQLAAQGDVCAVTGLSKTHPGEGLGSERDSDALSLTPVFSYAVVLPEGVDASSAYREFKKLEDEETELHIVQNEQTKEIEVQLMGEVQSEVLKQLILSRFDMAVEFTRGSVIYKETIASRVEGVGHYEPLRHYAEVHLRMEPLPQGAGLVFATECSEDVLDKNFQRLVLTHLAEKTHLGVLTGSPITDMKITLVNGKAHLKHTEGGDFRQATYRAVRQGLMQAESVLLEPWYDFVITLPQYAVGRAMTDIDRMGGELDAPEAVNAEISRVRGKAPISAMHGYDVILTSYTKGLGRLSCSFCGYGKCVNQDEVVASIAYDPEADIYNSPDSVFCAQGAGFPVKWYDVPRYMHLANEKTASSPASERTRAEKRAEVSDKELMQIFEATYGKIRRREYTAPKTINYSQNHKPYKSKPMPQGPEYLLIDGYNIIFAWDELKDAANESLEDARKLLLEKVGIYYAVYRPEIIVVFDAYKVKNNPGSIEKNGNITIVYTKEAETADSYIERVTHTLSKNHRVRVATSDSLEQMIILGNGAYRISANEFHRDVISAENEIRSFVQTHNLQNRNLDNKVLPEEFIKELLRE
ncbi:MAG: NYN domain-containing protein [Clostridia bacterium]|nr:NYN domain-containing protein [Clostridia bacterium]